MLRQVESSDLCRPISHCPLITYEQSRLQGERIYCEGDPWYHCLCYCKLCHHYSNV